MYSIRYDESVIALAAGCAAGAASREMYGDGLISASAGRRPAASDARPMPSPTRLAVKSGRLAAKRSAGAPKPVAKFRLRITSGEAIAVGPGKIALLEAIAETGSITAAAKHLEMSYRRAWMLLDDLNRCLKKPAVASAKGGQHGGGSELTPVGRQLIDLYRHIEEAAAAASKADMNRLVQLLAR